ncbi:class I SAM-dependent methyltransferase [Acaryochloris sp. IP29b_bin.148]|uniref:class I SAM-dependent methyltransferase n=1 Tax=Acaryochloris sp. IP29b_bin.148 TaxID=2969218 RepID=UPI002617C8C6|nr:class I SAM-dependent methyltransferase [Acaryochloris sp. IP29b_bin.148]
MDLDTNLSLLQLTCPICDRSSVRLFRKNDYWIRECDRCHHQFTEQQPTTKDVSDIYDGQYFQGDGAGYVDYLAEADLLQQLGQYYAEQLGFYVLPGSVLDVGAAAGFILKELLQSGWQGEGLEPNLRIAEFGQQQLDLKMTVGTLENYQTLERFDLVMMIQAIQHFYNLKLALHTASRVTKPGGYWLIETWDRSSLWARMRGRNWHAYTPPSRCHWFSPPGLERLVAEYGFQEIARGSPSKWMNGQYRKSVLRYQLMDKGWGKPLVQGLNLIPDPVKTPYLGGDIFWGLYQKTV